MCHNYLREICASHRALSSIDCIGGYENPWGPSLGDVTAIVLRNDQHHIGVHLLDILQSRIIRGFLTVEDEIVACLNALYKLTGQCGAVVIYYIHPYILHLLSHHPRHHAHHHNRENDDETW